MIVDSRSACDASPVAAAGAKLIVAATAAAAVEAVDSGSRVTRLQHLLHFLLFVCPETYDERQLVLCTDSSQDGSLRST